MAVVSKSGPGVEGMVRNMSFKWVLWRRGSVEDDDSGETEPGDAPAARNSWIPELSPFANVVIRRCSKIVGISPIKLRESFGKEACDAVKGPSCFSRSFFEYCCFRTLAFWISANLNHLSDKNFRLLTYDMMVAWDTPATSSLPLLNVGQDVTVGKEAFTRLAPAIPLVANVIISENLYELLSASTGGRLQFSVYEKYLLALERVRRRMKSRTDSSLLSAMRLTRGEKVLEVDGTIISQPILEHVGKYAWPGRITLTDQALYFEALRVVSYDKAKRYSLTERLEQVIKPELSGPLGTRVFDRAISYKSNILSEPIIIEFAELKGHSRRDYWLSITKEILFAHRFVDKFKIIGIEREEALSKAVLGILRTQAIRNMRLPSPLDYETLLMFSLCDQLPGGDLILEELARSSSTSSITEPCEMGWSTGKGGMFSMSSMQMVSSWGIVSGIKREGNVNTDGLVVGDLAIGKVSCLERAIKESINSYKEVVAAQASIDEAKVNGIHANLALMKELLVPVTILGGWLRSLVSWDDCFKSWVFCLVCSFIIFRGWLGYAAAMIPFLIAAFVAFARYGNRGKVVLQIKVVSPPKSSMEQLLAIREGITLVEGFIQDGNIFLLKLRALLLSSFPQASERFLVALIILGAIIAFIPCKYIILAIFLDTFTKFSPPRRKTTEKVMRRLRDWWSSIPAAPMTIERPGDERKKR